MRFMTIAAIATALAFPAQAGLFDNLDRAAQQELSSLRARCLTEGYQSNYCDCVRAKTQNFKDWLAKQPADVQRNIRNKYSKTGYVADCGY